jgi:hypothetical protein
MTTLCTFPRLEATPPLKSPDPHDAADAKPNATANTSGLIIWDNASALG